MMELTKGIEVHIITPFYVIATRTDSTEQRMAMTVGRPHLHSSQAFNTVRNPFMGHELSV